MSDVLVSSSAAPLLPRVVGALGGCLLLVAVSGSSGDGSEGLLPVRPAIYGNAGPAPMWVWAAPLGVMLAATTVALLLVRFWPYLIVAGGLLTLPGLAFELGGRALLHDLPDNVAGHAGQPLIVIGALAGAQSLIRDGRTAWGALVGGTAVGAMFLGTAMPGVALFTLTDDSLPYWHAALITAGLGAAGLAVSAQRNGDPYGEPSGGVAARVRYAVAGAVAVSATAVPALLTDERIAVVADVSWGSLHRNAIAVTALVGTCALVIGAIAAAVAGAWATASAMTVALAQVALAAPMLLAVWALASASPMRWAGAALGVGIGAAAAASRWRIAFAGAGAILTATALFIAFVATGGAPEKLIDQRTVTPAAVLLVGICATVTVLVGSVTTVLGRRSSVPAVLAPIVATLALGGSYVVKVRYVAPNGRPESSLFSPVHNITTSAIMLLVSAGALGALYLADALLARRSERRAAEAIRQQAAAAERERLARPIHDGVLQVLTLVERYGPELGDEGVRLAELARTQGASLRTLIASDPVPGDRGRVDLCGLLAALATDRVSIVVPAEPVQLPAYVAQELAAAVGVALANVAQHAGPTARAWVLVEDEADAVRVSVRDDGPGIPEGRLAQAQAAGRLGVAQSMIGRVRDLGGTVAIVGRPGEGTEVEFRVPRRR